MAERAPYPSEEQQRFTVRLSDGLRDRIRVAAEKNNRSMNSELLATLEEAYPAPHLDSHKISEIIEILHTVDDIEKLQSMIEIVNKRLESIGMPWKFDPIRSVPKDLVVSANIEDHRQQLLRQRAIRRLPSDVVVRHFQATLLGQITPEQVAEYEQMIEEAILAEDDPHLRVKR